MPTSVSPEISPDGLHTTVPVLGCSSHEESYPSLTNMAILWSQTGRHKVFEHCPQKGQFRVKRGGTDGCTAVRQQTGILNKSNTLTFLTTHTQLPCLSFGAGKYFRAIHRLKVVLIKFYNHKTIHSCSNNRYNIWVTCKSPVSTENLEHRALIRSPPHRIRMPDSPINLSDWVSS